MSKILIAFLTLTALGCPASDSVVYQDMPAASLSIALFQWRTHGFHLDCDPSVIQVVTANQDAINYVCHADIENNAVMLGCEQGNTIAIVDYEWNSWQREYVLQHELRHWLASCSSPPATPDGNHEIAAVWFPYNGFDLRYPSTWHQ